jgi:hypothetical protein
MKKKLDWRPFEEAREFVHSLGIKSVEEWDEYCKSGKKPVDIPAGVHSVYKGKGWNGFADFLGTTRQWLPFEQAREFVRSLGLKSVKEWDESCKSGRIPESIPRNPSSHYKDKGWNSWGDFLGTGTIAPFNKVFRPFVEAREFVRSLGLKTKNEYINTTRIKAGMDSQIFLVLHDNG